LNHKRKKNPPNPTKKHTADDSSQEILSTFQNLFALP
jgi:hypothetical protein